ncbi:C40 family peptidase [Paenibacillus sp. N3.4]|uniref:C40 family peptidase n=1 Tax=Paenibacillus sp. N3.4 TaxID=2603222 RepID=UPI0011CB99CA|nr:C40 family peptidase [Paenibacillus sp. N3.4]TXK76973.1 NlpC/P60 family protein [Paenibacillus sp. N3.4]
MPFMRKSRLSQSLVGISLSLTLLATGSLVINPVSAHAATSTAANSAVSSTKANSIVQTAQSYIGKVKYRFGVRDTQHLIMDCSAFTQMVFQKNGISIPWGSRAQAKVGTRVADKAHLSKGDLVLFSVSKPGQINHVGIYIGNGKFISNTTSSGVVISDINSGFWGSRYITGRHL